METYVSLLVLATALREQLVTQSVELANALVKRVISFNRRTLDVLAAKVVFYYSLAYERAGRIAETRSPLLALHRTCCLRHDEIGQATVLNLLLRNLLSQDLLDQAYKLARSVCPRKAFSADTKSYVHFCSARVVGIEVLCDCGDKAKLHKYFKPILSDHALYSSCRKV